ncbi:DUF2573 family protein [Bacillus altitudinis]|uniref:DUF2573 family protein n=1 Tax=Bacillus altitudinis TaxID=293387 RepID=UPI001E462060|nr:DUF2573 family protein [Bacillus altitudinis]
MGNELDEKLEGLLDKYTELLLGETNEELISVIENLCSLGRTSTGAERIRHS